MRKFDITYGRVTFSKEDYGANGVRLTSGNTSVQKNDL
jgi:hypothetical protein